MQAIFEIDVNRRTPKYQQIANSITKAIRQGKIKRGDRILSINQLSNEFMLSRDTVQKAYYMLEKDQILQAVRGKGFYINRTDVIQRYKILLIFHTLDAFNQLIFETLAKTLDNRASIDLKIFSGCETFLEETAESVAIEYDYCILMPGCCEQIQSLSTIRKIPADKLILLDNHATAFFPGSTSLCEDTEESIATALQQLVSQIEKYDSLLYLHPGAKDFTCSHLKPLLEFCRKHSLIFSCGEKFWGEQMSAGSCYLVRTESDLLAVMSLAAEKKWIPGTDIGIVSLHESGVNEWLGGGITTILPDPVSLGKLIAQTISGRKKQRLINIMRIVIRKSC